MEEIKKPKKTEIEYILISCCTCMRPEMLANALKSINEITVPKNIKIEILVCDNDPLKSGKSAVEDFSKESKFLVHYVSEENRGICFARNKVLDEAIKLNASHIFFFDDDEVLDKNSLIEHIKLYQTNEKAYISSGPAFNTFDKKYPNFITKNIIFKQSTTKETGLEREDCATNNVFFPVSLVKDFNILFSSEYRFMGGEDGDFFGRAKEQGFTIIWNNEAIVYEMVTNARANLKYIFKKSYYNGYSSALLKARKKKNKRIFVYLLTLAFYTLVTIPSILLGLTAFVNCISQFLKAKGKVDASIKNTGINFYQDIYGK